VIYEDDTPLYTQLRAGQFGVDEDLACNMYEELVTFATDHGFQQYEIANFARDTTLTSAPRRSAAKVDQPSTLNLPSHACQHNINYWRGGSFYGLGPSATSYVRGVRTKNWANTILYCEQLERGQRAIESREELDPLARAGEIAAFGLRMNMGWQFEQFQQIAGNDMRQEWSKEMNQLVEQGWGRIDPQGFKLTQPGLRFADSAAALFLR
jgi:oxygen-independent coproporphyrinogen-3 oxidase